MIIMKINKLKLVINIVVIALVLFGVGGLIYKDILNAYAAQLLIITGITIIIALSLNLISGFTGQLALGHAGFMAVGAYTTAVMMMKLNFPIFPSIIAGGLMSAVFGFLIGFPTLKLKGDYLAIVTLGFGEIIRVIMINLEGITGGAAGLKGVPSFTENLMLQNSVSYIWVYSFLIGTVIIMSNLIKSSPGRAIVSVREDEIASNSMGINIFYYKMFSFTVSAFFAGLGGGLYALYFGYLNPTMFDFLKSVDFLIVVVLGGMGSIPGTIIAGFIYTFLQEFLKFFEGIKEYRLVIIPLILILIMLFSPQGLVGMYRSVLNKFKKKEVGVNDSIKSR